MVTNIFKIFQQSKEPVRDFFYNTYFLSKNLVPVNEKLLESAT